MTSTPSSAAHRRDPPDVGVSVGLLDAAVARSRWSAFGEDAYPTLELKAAALLHSLVGNDALVDGNERLGWLATAVYLGESSRAPYRPLRRGARSDAVQQLATLAVERHGLWVAALGEATERRESQAPDHREAVEAFPCPGQLEVRSVGVAVEEGHRRRRPRGLPCDA